MKVLYLDCNMGAAGDMITAALTELFENQDEIVEELNAMGVPGVEFVAETVDRGGIVGTHMSVRINGKEEDGNWQVGDHEHDHDHHHEHHHHHHEHPHEHEHEHHHEHEHTGMKEIEDIINSLNVGDSVKKNAMKVYSIIAEGESKAHGHPVTEVHFHEVGKMDAIADVTAVCYLMEKLAPEKIMASTVAVGSGYVRCAHGILPVPAPATANILLGIPIKAGIIPSESCTPTGAALLKHFVQDYSLPNDITIDKIGYGMGGRVFPGIAGGLRAMWGNLKE
ncbi:MAG: LarC family nickel insertion protein [Firmicutes bacterium]|nr:LarC family nickel insertion protein [Bacillota bacterium]